MNVQPSRRLPAEWEPQSGILMAWPSENTDWAFISNRDDAILCYSIIINTVTQYEKVLLLYDKEDYDEVIDNLGLANMENLVLIPIDYNDTWTRDFGAITVIENGKPHLLDFQFNGWGLKYEAQHDNQITRRLVNGKILHGVYENHLGFVLEGGSIESDGQGTILTTTSCLRSINRNEYLTKEQIEDYLKDALGANRILWLDHGQIAGDDTDGHIDTLARFCSPNTIAYVQCTDPNHKLYGELKRMEQQLKSFTTMDGEPYRLVPLPLPDYTSADIFDRDFYDDDDDYDLYLDDEGDDEDEDLLLNQITDDSPFRQYYPATYANFLILNDVVLVPIYGQMKNDFIALQTIRELFPDRKVIDVNCTVLIEQFGSLHCATMHFPKEVIK